MAIIELLFNVSHEIPSDEGFHNTLGYYHVVGRIMNTIFIKYFFFFNIDA